LPWRNNKVSEDSSQASCISEGIHIVEKQEPNEHRPYGYFRFRAIAGRSINKYVKDKLGNFMSRCLWHRITFVKDLLGCIGIGGKFQDLNGDGVPDMIQSKDTLQWLYDNLPDVFELEIIEKQKTV